MLLDGRNAVIYGGGGAIGGAVARAFAREGARVHLAGRTPAPLERVAEQVRAAGGVAETAVVDALDEGAVDEHADTVAAGTGGIDICCNLISIQSRYPLRGRRAGVKMGRAARRRRCMLGRWRP
jgi:NAD(P)-dependent dehydrogenase (short-subunit alcohol dehydrogenase family)